ncbi:MAG: clostripain-related cysteine peptidase [Thermoplasmata archaeon]|jgi:hypothetical protein|nr:clostripain-related cysteine peptidase [Thermoplasmata archaeon]
MLRTTRIAAALGVFFVMLASGLLVGMPVRAAEPYEWTIAVYGDADNNLEGAWDKYTDPMLKLVPASDDVKIVSLLDRFSTMTAEIIEYSYGESTAVATYPEKNLGDPSTLTWFIQEVAGKYPSNKLAVIMWDHGGGWWGVCWDDTDHDYLTLPEFSAGVSNAGVYIDVLGFDACMMAGIEVVYDSYLTGLVGMMVASEQLVPYNGFPYDLMFTPLASDPLMTKEEVADSMVYGWQMYYGNKGTVDLSAIDVSVIGRVVQNEFLTWVDAMDANLDMYLDDYLKAYKKSEMVKGWYIVDMAQFAMRLQMDRDITDAALKAATSALVSAIDLGVNAQSGGGKTPLAGMTLWFGIDGEYANYGLDYSMLSFAVDTGWYDFMSGVNGY